MADKPAAAVQAQARPAVKGPEEAKARTPDEAEAKAQDGARADADAGDTHNTKEEGTMPGGDGTGPSGTGPMTGRAAGDCAGYPAPGFTNSVLGRGFGRRGGRGGGYGHRNWFYATGLPGWMRGGAWGA